MRNSLPRGARRRRRSKRWSSDGRCDRIPAKRRRSDACLRVRGADRETSRTRAGHAAGGQSETQVRPPERAGPGARGAAILGSGACRDERRARERGAWRRSAAWHGRRHELVTKTCFRGAFGGARLSRSALARSATKAEPRKLRRPVPERSATCRSTAESVSDVGPSTEHFLHNVWRARSQVWAHGCVETPGLACLRRFARKIISMAPRAREAVAARPEEAAPLESLTSC